MVYWVFDCFLDEYGANLDGFVWDETFELKWNTVGPANVPGYAARAMMDLVEDLAKITHNHPSCKNNECVFLTSDCLGADGFPGGNVPFSLVSDGTYQDTEFNPGFWGYARMPNYRNSVWCCLWNTISDGLDKGWLKSAVEQENIPSACSNGWGDGLGISELSKSQQQLIMQYFAEHKIRP